MVLKLSEPPPPPPLAAMVMVSFTASGVRVTFEPVISVRVSVLVSAAIVVAPT